MLFEKTIVKILPGLDNFEKISFFKNGKFFIFSFDQKGFFWLAQKFEFLEQIRVLIF